MNYVEIQNEIELVLESIKDRNNEKYTYEDEIGSIKKTIEDKRDSKSLELKQAEERARIEYEENISEPFNREIKKLEDYKVKASLKKDDRLEKINDGSYVNKYKSKIDIDKDLETCKSIKEKTSDFYGKEFTEIIEMVVADSYQSPEDISKILNEVNTVSGVLSKSFNLTDVVHNLFSSFEYNEDNKNQVYLSAFIAVVIIIGSIILYPILLVSMIFTLVYSCYKSYFFIKATTSRKSLERNVISIKEEIDRNIYLAIKKDKEKTISNYNDYIQKIDRKIYEIENDCLVEHDTQRDNFMFDSTSIEANYEVERISLEDKLELMSQNMRKCDSDLKDLKIRLQGLQTDLDASLRTVTSVYMPTEIVPNEKLPDDYLLDIQNDDPYIIEIPKKSILFVYNDDDYSDNFLSLFFYQTVLRTSPDLLRFNIFDVVTLGTDFLSYSKDELVNICDDTTKIKEVIDGCNYEMKKRNSIISQDFDSIVEYNEFMLKNDCPAETYNFIIYKCKVMSELLEPSNLQLLVNGGKVGYYEYIFMSMEDIVKCSEEEVTTLTNSLGAIYSIDKNRLSKRVAMFLINKLEK